MKGVGCRADWAVLLCSVSGLVLRQRAGRGAEARQSAKEMTDGGGLEGPRCRKDECASWGDI